MAWIIISVVVGFVLLKFIVDRNKLQGEITKIGGMSEAYHILLDDIQNSPISKKNKETNDFVEYIWEENGSASRISVLQTFSGYVVNWEVKSSWGKVSNRWEFEKNTDQNIARTEIGNGMKLKYAESMDKMMRGFYEGDLDFSKPEPTRISSKTIAGKPPQHRNTIDRCFEEQWLKEYNRRGKEHQNLVSRARARTEKIQEIIKQLDYSSPPFNRALVEAKGEDYEKAIKIWQQAEALRLFKEWEKSEAEKKAPPFKND
jgi:hypothetical protein